MNESQTVWDQSINFREIEEFDDRFAFISGQYINMLLNTSEPQAGAGHRYSLGSLAGFKAMFLCLLLTWPISASTQTAADTGEPIVVGAELLIKLSRLTEEQLTEIHAGQVAEIRVPQDKPLDANAFDIYTAFAILIDAPTSAVGQVLVRREWAGAGIVGAQIWRLDNAPEFPEIEFRDRDSREVARILKGKDEVNLSAAELQGL